MPSKMDRELGAFRVLCFGSFVLLTLFQQCKGEQVTAWSGQDLTLRCHSPINTTIVLLEWSRPDLERDGYIFFYSGNDLLRDFQLRSYMGRVDPVDPKMEGRDGSVTLRNVQTMDSGKYVCIIVFRGSEPQQDYAAVQRVVELKVKEDGILSYSKDGQKDTDGKAAIGAFENDDANEEINFTHTGEQMTVSSGQDVPLRCRSPGNTTIVLLEWTRLDLDKDSYVLFYRKPMVHSDFQHPRYRGRVLLRDPRMRNGDGSVIVRNVNVNDTGTYVCATGQKPSQRSKRSAVIQSVITLTVKDSAHPEATQRSGVTHVHQALVPALASVAFSSLFCYRFNVLFLCN